MRNLIIVTGLLGIALQFYYVSNLPATVANHFGAGGNPNGWMSNNVNFLFSTGMIVLISSIFLSVPVALRKSPISIINFPKKTYWLAPERKEKSIPIISNWLQFMGVATNIFLLIVYHLVFLANKSTPARLNNEVFLATFITFLIIMLWWLIAFFVKFNKT